MLERAKRLQEVYVYLHKNRNIPTKAEFAESIDYARAYVSSALNGNEKYLTKSCLRVYVKNSKSLTWNTCCMGKVNC